MPGGAVDAGGPSMELLAAVAAAGGLEAMPSTAWTTSQGTDRGVDTADAGPAPS